MNILKEFFGDFRNSHPVWFWIIVIVLGGSFISAVGSVNEADDVKTQELNQPNSCFPEVDSRLDDDEKVVVEWALEKIQAYAPSDDWWCGQGIRSLHASATDQSVFFETWSDFSLNQP